jgi:peptidoglycan hydrolase CwlO-like protein
MPPPPVNSALNYPLELSPALVPIGGGVGQVLSKLSANPWDLVWATPAAGITIPLAQTLSWSADNTYDIGAGGSSGRPRDLYVARNSNLNAVLANALTLAGAFLFSVDNANDIGAASASRPRNIYVAGAFIGKGSVPTGGSAGYVLAKNTATAYDVVWVQPVTASDITNLQNQITSNTNSITALTTRVTNSESAINTLQNQVSIINTQISTINSQLADLQDSIDNNTSDIDFLMGRMQAAETSLNNLSSQISALSSQVSSQGQDIITLQNQMSSANTELSDHEQRLDNLEGGSVAPTDPYIGAVVHVRDSSGHCQPAIVYEDWKAQNAKDIVSVVVVSPYRLQESNWNSKIEVQKENGQIGGPFAFWHWPERYYAGVQILTRR